MKWFMLFLLISWGSWAESEIRARKPVPKLPQQAAELNTVPEIQLNRLDPHGPRGEKPTLLMQSELKACSVCHRPEATSANQSCLNCHNSGPHSGVAEHLKHQITCSSCHSPHRGDEIAWKPGSGKFRGLYGKPLATADWVERPAASAMLKKNCMDCHNKW